MRLIDADALEEAIENSRGKNSIYAQFVRAWVKEAPTIDAVPVVRCKDCKRRMNAKKNGIVYWDGYEYYCLITRYGVTDDGFCFYGEREEDE